ncbi:MAG: hypothetical protein AB8C84_12440 [Oligoflexales bacterium]
MKLKTTLLFFFLSAPLFGNTMTYQSSLNRFSPTERASSHGVGVNLGSGFEQIRTPEEDGSISTQTVTRAWLTKGIFWPLDIGLGLASFEEEKSYSGYIQYTLYEKFMTPAIALRTTHSRMFVSTQGPLHTTTAQILASWGYRSISLWANFGYAHHIQVSDTNDYHQWGELTQDAGFYWHLFPPFIAVSAEVKTAQTSPKSYAFKVSIGI